MNRRVADVVWFVVPLAFSACSTEPETVRPDASNDASDGAADVQNEAAPCTQKPRPNFVPDGWVAWDAYTPCSGFFVPTKTDHLPPGFQWETCPLAATPVVNGCKSVVLDPAGTGSVATDVSVGANGKAVVLFGQDYKDRQLFTLADADGSVVHAALLVADRSTFAVAAAVPKSFIYPRYALNAVDMLGKKTDGVRVGRTRAERKRWG
ncbi:hypothetical protein BH09MYX1_BH09MYX1_61790 [soil metagenome]